MKKTFLIISAVVLTTLVACKKETTTPSSTTNTTNTNTNSLSYGQYTGTGTSTTETKYYNKNGDLIPSMSSLSTQPDMGVAILGKDGNGNSILSGGGFVTTPLKITGTNFNVDEYQYSKTVNGTLTTTQTLSGSGTIIGKDITVKSVFITTAINTDQYAEAKTIVITKTTSASYHFYV